MVTNPTMGIDRDERSIIAPFLGKRPSNPATASSVVWGGRSRRSRCALLERVEAGVFRKRESIKNNQIK